MAVTEQPASPPTFSDVNRVVLASLRTPGPLYFAWMCVIGLLLAAFLTAWTYQIYIGMGAAGKRAFPRQLRGCRAGRIP